MSETLSRGELLRALRAFAEEIGETPTRTRMNAEGPYSSQPYYREFGGWNDALAAAGLTANHRNGVPDEELIEELRRLDDALERVPRFEDMEAEGAFSAHTYVRRWGSWPDAKDAAGLCEETRTSRRISEEELVEALIELAQELGKAPTQEEMNDLGRFSQRPYYRVWDSWGEALRAAGLDPERDFGTPKDELLEEMRRLADELGRTPTMEQMKELGRYSVWPYLRAFESYNEAVREADLSVNKVHGTLEGTVDYGPDWPEQREKALERDNWICQDPNCDVTDEEHRGMHGQGLDVHHIKKVRLFEKEEDAHRLENLVALCRACHVKWERWKI